MVMARKKEKKEKDILDQLLDTIDFQGLTQNEVAGKNGIIKQLTGRILQRALDAEMTGRLGYEKNSSEGDNSGNSRNGHTEKQYCLKIKARLLKFHGIGTERLNLLLYSGIRSGCRYSTIKLFQCTRAG
jgi:hypothetical protein